MSETKAINDGIWTQVTLMIWRNGAAMTRWLDISNAVIVKLSMIFCII